MPRKEGGGNGSCALRNVSISGSIVVVATWTMEDLASFPGLLDWPLYVIDTDAGPC